MPSSEAHTSAHILRVLVELFHPPPSVDAGIHQSVVYVWQTADADACSRHSPVHQSSEA